MTSLNFLLICKDFYPSPSYFRLAKGPVQIGLNTFSGVDIRIEGVVLILIGKFCDAISSKLEKVNFCIRHAFMTIIMAVSIQQMNYPSRRIMLTQFLCV